MNYAEDEYPARSQRNGERHVELGRDTGVFDLAPAGLKRARWWAL